MNTTRLGVFAPLWLLAGAWTFGCQPAPKPPSTPVPVPPTLGAAQRISEVEVAPPSKPNPTAPVGPAAPSLRQQASATAAHGVSRAAESSLAAAPTPPSDPSPANPSEKVPAPASEPAAPEPAKPAEPDRAALERRIEELTAEINTLIPKGRLRDALSASQEVQAAIEKIHGPQSWQSARYRGSLARLYQLLGDLPTAKAQHIQALKVLRQLPEDRHTSTLLAFQLRHLGVLNLELNDLAMSEYCLAESAERFDQLRLVGQVARTQIPRSEVLHNIGQSDAAILMLQAAITVLDRDSSATPSDRTAARNLLAKVFIAERRPDDAQKVIAEMEQLLSPLAAGKTRPVVLLPLQAGLAILRGEFDAADVLLGDALADNARALGPDNPATLKLEADRASLAYERGDWTLAEQRITSAMERLAQVLGAQHSTVRRLAGQLALTQLMLGKTESAWQHAERALAVTSATLRNTGPILSEREQLVMVAQARISLEILLAATADRADADGVYAWVLTFKGQVTDRQRQARRLMHEASGDTRRQLDLLTQQIVARQFRYQLIARSTPHPSLAKVLAKLGAEMETLERQRNLLVQQLARTAPRGEATPSTLQKSLPSGTVLVDLIGYWKPTPASVADTPADAVSGRLRPVRHVAAFVIRPDAPIVRVELGPVVPLAKLVTDWKSAGFPDTPALGRQVRQKVWLPIERHLVGTDTLVICPDGELIPWAAIPGDTVGECLLDRWAVATVPVASWLAQPSRPAAAASAGLLLVGDLDYGPTNRNNPVNLRQLPGTAEELNRLSALWAQHHPKEPTQQLTKTEASLTAVHAAMTNKRIVHFATHGLVGIGGQPRNLPKSEAPQPFEPDLGLSAYPEALAALAVTGANFPDGRGLLTAQTAKEAHLNGTELVVLSACSSGTGLQSGSEGVLGLTRALHVAGAEAVVGALWPVDDQPTAVFMERFYRELWCQPGTSALQAFRAAQLAMRREYKFDRENLKLTPRGSGGSVGVANTAAPKEATPATPTGEGCPPTVWVAFQISVTELPQKPKSR